MQRARDAARGIASQGFISGYRGSPLGMVDQQAWKAAKLLDAAGVKFLPAINEELGATAVLGTQRVESDPERTADGVFAMWYGKGPGVDRAGDALKHGNAYGSSPHGGVLVVAGDDHGCVSSSMPHQSDLAMQSWHMPVRRAGQRRRVPRVRPVRLGAVALLGQLGRLHGALGSRRERLDRRPRRDERARRRLEGRRPRSTRRPASSRPPTACTTAGPTCRRCKIEARLHAKLDAVRAFAQGQLDRPRRSSQRRARRSASSPAARRTSTCSRCFRRLDIPLDALAAAGVRLYKVGLALSARADAPRRLRRGPRRDPRRRGKGRPSSSTQMRDLFYNRAGAADDRRQARRARARRSSPSSASCARRA